MKKIAIFASGSGSNAENIAGYFAAGNTARVELILTNRPDAKVLRRAEKLQIESVVFDRDTFYNSDRIVVLMRRRQDRLRRIGRILVAGTRKPADRLPEPDREHPSGPAAAPRRQGYVRRPGAPARSWRPETGKQESRSTASTSATTAATSWLSTACR